jgi:hypothetical protein
MQQLTNGGIPMSTRTAVENLLGRVQDWWRTSGELGAMDRQELDRIAHDLGMTSDDLTDLAARGPDAANLLFERMRALGISKNDVDHAAQGLMRDLERTCSCCTVKGGCERDLADRPEDPRWQSYCPNAATLQSLAKLNAEQPA